MKMKKFLSALMACAALSASAPAMPATYASQEYTDGTYQSITYRNYGDHIRITGCEDSAAEIAIPAEINGRKVSVVAAESFRYNENVEHVVIPDGVTEIQPGAFMNCSNLKSVVIPESVSEINEDTFLGCDSLESLTIENPECIIHMQRRS